MLLTSLHSYTLNPSIIDNYSSFFFRFSSSIDDSEAEVSIRSTEGRSTRCLTWDTCRAKEFFFNISLSFFWSETFSRSHYCLTYTWPVFQSDSKKRQKAIPEDLYLNVLNQKPSVHPHFQILLYRSSESMWNVTIFLSRLLNIFDSIR